MVTDRIDRFGRYHHIDPECGEILGYPQEHYAHEVGWVRFNHLEDRWRTAVLWQKALTGRPCPVFEYRTFNSDRQWVWLQDSLRPILFDRDGHALVVEGRWRDITPRKRREAEFLLRQWETLWRAARPRPRGNGAIVIPFPSAIVRP